MRGALRTSAISAAFLALAALPVHGLDPARGVTQYALRQWTAEQGLPQNSVQAMAQTPDGYLWVATQDGLARFDGMTFTIFDSTNTPALLNNNITALVVDRAGALWVGTETAGLVCHREGRFEAISQPDLDETRHVRQLFLDSGGGVWAALRHGVLLHFSPGKPVERLVMPPGPAEKTVTYSIAEDASGRILFGTYRNGLFVLDDGRIVPHEAPGGPAHIYRLLRDSRGTVWAATEGQGLMRLDGRTWRRYGPADGLTESNVYCIREDHRGTLWAGSYGGGLFRLDPDGRFSSWAKERGFPATVLLCLFEDREGSLWAGTQGAGLLQLRDGLFLPFGVPEGLAEEMVSCVLEDRGGALWAGTYGAGLWRLHAGGWTRFGRREGLPDETVYSLAESKRGGLWVGTGGGVCRLEEGQRARPIPPEKLPSTMVYSLLESSDGSLWIGTGAGLVRLSGTDWTTWSMNEGLKSLSIVSLHEDAAGTVWVGTYAGLGRILQGRFEPQGPAFGDPDMQVFGISEDPRGGLWFATYGRGLVRLHGAEWTPFTTREGLPTDYLYDVLVDASGDLWVTTSRGIFRADRASIEMAQRTRAPLTFRAFGRDDGLRSTECNGGSQPASWRGRGGRLWFPTVRGLASMNPSLVPREGAPPRPIVQSMVCDGHGVEGAGVDLPPGRGDLEIRYTAPTFSSPSRLRFRYRLPPFQSEWVEAGDRRTAYFTRVPPGRYRFEVQAALGDGPWGEGALPMLFRLRPHFYQTGLFFALCALALLLTVGLVFLGRVRQLKARQRELEGLVAARTADLSAALKTVSQQKEELRTFNEELEAKVRDQLEAILRSRRLTKYFPRKMVDAILGASGDAELGSERRLITIFFTDLQGFSALTESVEPERLTALINGYLGAMAALVDAHGGTLARFMGDGILGFFGTPDPMPPDEQALRSVEMGLAMQRSMRTLKELWAKEGIGRGLALRIGIHQDFVTVGNFGSPDLMEYTAIGRGINLAKRLESACPPGHLLVTEAVQGPASVRYDFSEPEERAFKGFSHPVRVCVLDPWTGRNREEPLAPEA